jgi:hypothetical protein
VNPRTRRAALYAIGAIAMLASANALTHSYAGLYDWAAHHSLTGWQAMSWPAEIDVFLAIGELALYVAYLDGWPTRQRIWPWATALIYWASASPGTSATSSPKPATQLSSPTGSPPPPARSPRSLAWPGLLVLKMTRQQTHSTTNNLDTSAHQPRRPSPPGQLPALASVPDAVPARSPGPPPDTGAGLPRSPVKNTAATRTRPHRAASAAAR